MLIINMSLHIGNWILKYVFTHRNIRILNVFTFICVYILRFQILNISYCLITSKIRISKILRHTYLKFEFLICKDLN